MKSAAGPAELYCEKEGRSACGRRETAGVAGLGHEDRAGRQPSMPATGVLDHCQCSLFGQRPRRPLQAWTRDQTGLRGTTWGQKSSLCPALMCWFPCSAWRRVRGAETLAHVPWSIYLLHFTPGPSQLRGFCKARPLAPHPAATHWQVKRPDFVSVDSRWWEMRAICTCSG